MMVLAELGAPDGLGLGECVCRFLVVRGSRLVRWLLHVFVWEVR